MEITLNWPRRAALLFLWLITSLARADVVEFTLRAPQAKQVFLAGEMTNWDEGERAMSRDADGVWRLSVALAARYRDQYGFGYALSAWYPPELIAELQAAPPLDSPLVLRRGSEDGLVQSNRALVAALQPNALPSQVGIVNSLRPHLTHRVVGQRANVVVQPVGLERRASQIGQDQRLASIARELSWMSSIGARTTSCQARRCGAAICTTTTPTKSVPRGTALGNTSRQSCPPLRPRNRSPGKVGRAALARRRPPGKCWRVRSSSKPVRRHSAPTGHVLSRSNANTARTVRCDQYRTVCSRCTVYPLVYPSGRHKTKRVNNFRC